MTWKSIDGYEGLYEVSDTGLVRSLNFNHTGRAKLLKPGKNRRGYLYVNLCKNGKAKNILVHRLVALAFIPNPLNLETVNHKDEDKQNNVAGNLEWMTSADNSNYGTRNKRVAESLSKQVQMLDRQTGEPLAVFSSMYEAEQQTGVRHSSIVRCCKGRYKSAGGYVWKYA